MRTLKLLTALAIILLQATNAAAAGKARRQWTKIEVSNLGHDHVEFPPGFLKAFQAEVVSDYGTFVILHVPENAADGLARALQNRGLAARHRDGLDVLHLPNATIDTRIGIGNVPAGGLISSYPAGKPGVFVIQLSAPPTSQWLSQLESLGWQLARYVPDDAYLAIGESGLTPDTRRLPFVQWLDFYHPYQKYAQLARDGVSRPLIFDLPNGPDLTDAIERIGNKADEPIRVVRSPRDTRVYAKMAHHQAESLLREPLIIGVDTESPGGISDERQATSLTSNLNASQSHLLTPRPQNYWNWVLSKCSNCASTTTSDDAWRDLWRIGFVDYGLDDGRNVMGQGHPDLEGRKAYGLVPTSYAFKCTGLTPSFPNGCDWYYHGTAVASVAAGNPPVSAPVDPDGYTYGGGVAPRAGMFMTSSRFLNHNDFFDWTTDAIANQVTIQNHSFNEYAVNPDTSGTYTMFAADYDAAVRDADPDTAGQQPLFLTVPTGNNDQFAGTWKYYSSAAGTSKNVLAVGGIESDRNASQPCNDCESEGFHHIMKISRIGTRIPGYIKPDVVAPASAVVTARSTAVTSSIDTCGLEPSSLYVSRSGTSFAAPVAAGAAIIVKRYLGTTAAATSPALTKAMLIAGARSIAGGEDRTQATVIPITAVPSMQQGFGRLSFEDILTSTPPRTYDQNADRTFTATGQRVVARFRVRDSAAPVKVVLVWTDVAGNPANTSNALVNNLDLQVFPAASPAEVYLGNKLTAATEYSTAYPRNGTLSPDDVNNVEIARFPLAANGEFDVAVVAASLTSSIDEDPGAKQDFALVVVNADQLSGFAPTTPGSFQATGSSDPTGTSSAVSLTWTASTGSGAGIHHYEIRRRSTLAQSFQFVANVTDLNYYTDTTGIQSWKMYQYRIVAVDPSGNSSIGATDYAVTVTFTDDFTSSTPIPHRGEHLAQLRAAADGWRQFAGESRIHASYPSATGLVTATDFAGTSTSLVEALNVARSAMLLPPFAYSGVPSPGSEGEIKKEHVQQLRDSMK